MAKKKPRPSIQEIQEVASSCKTKSEFQKEHPFHYRMARESGVLPDVTAHMIDKRDKWTAERIKLEVEKYETINEFRNGSPKAYQAARYHGLMEEISEILSYDRYVLMDSVYIVHLIGTDLYKPGVTSSKRGLTRVNDLATRHGYDLELLIQMQVGPTATNVEKQLLTIGKFTTNIPEGVKPHSELRSWNKEQLQEAMEILFK